MDFDTKVIRQVRKYPSLYDAKDWNYNNQKLKKSIWIAITRTLCHKRDAKSDAELRELVESATAAREHAYSPYSKFKVGAALRCEDGSISRGCNVENASYPVGICAERTALVKAVSEGKTRFKALAVVADGTAPFTSPCGLCRQMIAEFGDMPVYLSRSDMEQIFKTSVKDILPIAFGIGNALILK